MSRLIARRRSEALETAIDDEAIVFDPVSKRAHRLNPSATAIWRLIDGTRTIDDVVDSLHRAYAVDREQLDRDVRRVVEWLGSNDLLDVDGVPRDRGPVPASPATTPVAPPAAPMTSSFAVVGRRVAFRIDDERARRVLEWYFSPLAEPGDPDDVYDIATTVDGRGERRYDACLDPGMPMRGAALDALAPGLINRMNRVAGVDRDHLVVLHASASLAPGDGVVLFPGDPGAGKSTLVTTMTQRGFAYLTDEAIGIEPGSLVAHGYRKRIALDEGSWPLFAELEPRLPAEFADLGPAWRWDVDPVAVHPDALREPERSPRVAMVVFPRRVPDAELSHEELHPADALLSLMANAFNLAGAGQPGLDALAAVATTLPCYRLTYAEAGEAVEAITTLLDRHHLS